MSSQFKRGSEWRKWDLHVHTPASIIQNYGGDNDEAWEEYITDLESLPREFSVLGINDYLFIDGYERLRKEKEENNRLQNIDLLLPVLEFRLEKFAGIGFDKWQRVNLHVIFSNEIEVEKIKSQFLNTLEQSYKLQENGKEWHNTITRKSLEELGSDIKSTVPESQLSKYDSDIIEGFNNLNLTFENIKNSLAKPCFEGKYLIAIGKTEWSELKWSESSIGTKKDIINNADLIFTASESIERFNNSRQTLIKQGVNSRLLDCSDAHDFSESNEKDRIGNCNTWIKADPTFEGLKQVIYEHEERVCISEENPFLSFDKPYFSNIVIDDDVNVFIDDEELKFEKCDSIPLNQNLVAVIGGRGEGKSMLVEYLASSFNDHKQTKDGQFNKNGEFIVTYNKSSTNNEDVVSFEINEQNHELDFIYISQGELKSLVDDEKEKNQLAQSIKKLARLKDVVFSNSINDLVKAKIDRYFEIKDFLNKKDEQGNLLNSVELLEERKAKIGSFIDNITTKENKDKLRDYSTNLKRLNLNELKLSKLRELNTYLNNVVNEINIRIESLNLENDIPFAKKDILEQQFKCIDNQINAVNTEIESLNISIGDIKLRFSEYKGDLSTLLDEVKIYQKQLADIENDIKNIKLKEIELNKLHDQIYFGDSTSKSLIKEIEAQYKSMVDELSNSWDTFKDIEAREDLDVQQKDLMKSLLKDLDAEIILDFDINEFYNKITDCINGSKWRIKNNTEAQIKEFGITDFESFIDFLENNFEEMCDRPEIYQNILKDICFSELHRKNYIKIFPVLKYKNKSLNKISAGQKGTVYLKMKLATSAFSKPIIFDQPEDDLDNDFIVKDLINLFKELKKYRQVIIVTHNANLVVNADAEQVVIASNDEGRLNYLSGSLESSDINSEICRILEGGDIAFNNRRSKYQTVG